MTRALKRRFLMHGPLTVLIVFYTVTVLMFVSDWLIDYPERNRLQLAVILVASVLLIGLGYICGLRWRTPDVKLGPLPMLGLLALGVLLIPTVKTYTGYNLTDFSEVILNPQEAHRNMVETVSSPREERIPLLMAKAIVSPFTVLVLPFFAYQALRYGRHRMWFFIAVALHLLLSVFRGTDKEVFDVFILVAAAGSVAVAQRDRRRERSRDWQKYAVVGLIALIIAFSVVGARKAERIPGTSGVRCFAESGVCFPLSIGEEVTTVSKASITLWGYLTQGYYGLSVALDAEYSPGYGFGHSRPLRFLAEKVGVPVQPGVTGQLESLGWHDKALWSSGLTWIANDIPFPLVPWVLGAGAFLLAVTWRSSLEGSGGLALVLFSYLFYVFLFMPANLTLAQTGDTYLGVLVWIAIWVVVTIRGAIKGPPEVSSNGEERLEVISQ